MTRLLLFTSAISALLFLLVLLSVRRSRIRVEYSVGWLLASLALFILSRSAWLLRSAASTLHVEQPELVLLIGAFGVLLLLAFWGSILISQLRDDTIALVQRTAILEFHLERISRELKVVHGSIRQNQ